MSIPAAFKRCSYYDCDENQLVNNDLTYFKFPPHAEKARVWAERAEVVVDQNLKYKYLCEKHFSPIYINRGIKRTILLSTAVPYALGEDEANFEVPTNPIGARTPRYHSKALSLKDVDTETQMDELIVEGVKEEMRLPYADNSDSEYLDETEIVIEAPDVADKQKINRKRTFQPSDNDQPLLLIARQPTKVKKCYKIDTADNCSPEEYTTIEEERDDEKINSIEIEECGEHIPTEAIEECAELNGAECSSPEPEIPKDYFIFINQGEQWIQLPKRVYQEQCVTINKLQRDLDAVETGQQLKVLQLQEELKRYKQFVRSMRGQFNKFESK